MLVQRPAEQAFRIAGTIDAATVVRLVLTLSCAAALSGIAEAAAYPARPMRFIVPFAPGGNGDIMGRLLGQRLSENLGQQVVVDNRAGASNIIGKVLGMTGAKRSPLAPDVPTISEAGVAGYQASIWNGILAPAATPRAIIGKLNTEIVRVLASPEARQRFSSMGTEVAHSSPEEFGAFIRSEIQKWAAVLKGAGIKAE